MTIVSIGGVLWWGQLCLGANYGGGATAVTPSFAAFEVDSG